MKVLFITPRFPFPPLKGDKVVAYNRLKYLSVNHSITLLTLYENKNELKYLPELYKFCKKIITIRLTRYESYLNILLQGFFSTLPFQALYYNSYQFRKAIKKLNNEDNFEIIHFCLIRVAYYSKYIKGIKVLDIIDSMELNLIRRLGEEQGVKKIILKEELKRLKKYEKKIINEFDLGIVVSEIDKNFINSSKVVEIPLGVEDTLINNNKSIANNKTINFTGNLGYFPNENAINWFLVNCYPNIKADVPEMVLKIVGPNPSRKIKSLDDGKNIIVKGYVDSIQEELLSSQISIAPMQAGTGMQNKVLEAMACGLPVVATQLGKGSINAIDNKEIIVANDSKEFSSVCVSLLTNFNRCKEIGTAAKDAIKKQYSWLSKADRLENLYFKLISDNENVS